MQRRGRCTWRSASRPDTPKESGTRARCAPAEKQSPVPAMSWQSPLTKHSQKIARTYSPREVKYDLTRGGSIDNRAAWTANATRDPPTGSKAIHPATTGWGPPARWPTTWAPPSCSSEKTRPAYTERYRNGTAGASSRCRPERDPARR